MVSSLLKGAAMNYKPINNKGQARIFKNQHLEMLTKTRPWVILLIYIPTNIFLVIYAWLQFNYSLKLIAVLFSIAMFCWTLFEYLVHRFLFHFETNNIIGKRLVYIFHENHHDFPRDKSRLFMPPAPSILMALMVFLLFYGFSLLFTGSGGYAMIFFSGFISGYLVYVSLHYAIHSYPPPKCLKTLWRNHHLHHYKYPDKAFGVSLILWDKLFGTLPKTNKPMERKELLKNLQ
jgi:sterol desaturase/sphingolipid hydroxylase (fatty acid hydroxylase superfamily)